MQYFWQGKEIFLIPGQQFTSHWNCFYYQSTEDGNSKKVTVAVRPEEISNTLEVDNVIPLNKEASPSIKVDKVSINKSTYTEINKNFPMIGRTTARTIIRNRPKDGYENFETMQKINKDLSINWEELKDKVVF